MSEQEEKRIVPADESEIHDEPHIAGTRVTVRHVHQRVEEDGLRPETLANRLDLSRAQVYNALAYYHENPKEMKEVREKRQRKIEEGREEAVTPEDVE